MGESIARQIVDIAFPFPDLETPEPIQGIICDACGEPLLGSFEGSATVICTNCTGITWDFERARAGYRMEGTVRDAITGFKYRQEYFWRGDLVEWLVETYDRHFAGAEFSGVVPVPLHRLRKRARGFNQAHELCLGLRESRRELKVHDALVRLHPTFSQATLDREKRLKNVEASIQIKPKFDVSGLSLLIVDDVFTTGATAQACAGVLASAGAARLAVLTVARS